MWVRLRLDIGWRDLARGLAGCLLPGRRDRAEAQASAAWGGDGDYLIPLSVRSGFDLLLRAMDLPRGSEVLLSALTVPDMARVVEAHGLVPVPVDIDASGRVCARSLQRSVTANSRVLVVAQLFGARRPMDEEVAVAKRHGLLVVEDLAQGFRAVGDAGDRGCDVSMFSFGPIKSATALGGAVVRLSDSVLRQRMAELLAGDPVQSRASFARRVGKYALLKLVSGRVTARLLRASLHAFGYDFDAFANAMVRGFAQPDLMKQLRRRPSTPLLRLLAHRWRTYGITRIDRRVAMGRRLDHALGLGRDAGDVYWVYPLFTPQASTICARLNAAGFDATCRARMAVVPGLADGRCAERAEQLWRSFVFLPWFPELPDGALDAIARLVVDARPTACLA